MKIREALEDYLQWLVIEKGRRPATLDAYRRDLHRFLLWLDDDDGDVRTFTRDLVVAYLDALRETSLAPSSISRHWSALRGWCSYLTNEGILTLNPTAKVNAGRRTKTLPKPLGELQVLHLLDSINGRTPLDLRDRALIELLYGTGARVSEAVGIELQHVDFDEELIVVTGKGSKQRLVPMGYALVRALRAYLQPDGRGALVRDASKSFLFLNHFGGALSRQGVDLLLRRRALAAGVPTRSVSAHVFRHSCATHMLEHGADIRIVQELLGHASIATTQIYTAVSIGSLRTAYADAHPRAHD